MKATGIVRRVDSLGRVVIPKEIRHTLRIKEGAPLEIYTDRDGSVTFRKYSPLGELQDFAAQICEAIRSSTGCIAAITDRDAVVALSGAPRRDFVDRPCSRDLDHLMEQRGFYCFQPGSPALPLSDLTEKLRISMMAPVISQGDLIGSVLILQSEDGGTSDPCHELLLKTIADFLGRQMEL